MARTLTKHQQKRRSDLIRQLSDLSRNGWAIAKPYDYQALEAELRGLDLTQQLVEAMMKRTTVKDFA